MADPNALGDALASLVLAGTDGLNVYYPWPEVAMLPCGIWVDAGQEDEFVLGVTPTLDLARFDWELLVAVNIGMGTAQAHRTLNDYRRNTGGNSIRAALAADRTLGGIAHSLFVGTWDRPHDEEINQVTCLVSRLPVTVWAS